MKTFNKINLVIAMIGFTMIANGQQNWQWSQYLQNEFLLNPAFAGNKDMLKIDMSYRQQWLGIEYAPTTYYLSGNARIFESKTRTKPATLPTSQSSKTTSDRKVHQAIGGLVLRDKFGAFYQTLIAGSYAVHVPLSKKWTLSTGLEFSMKNFVFDPSVVKMENISDPTLANFYNNTVQYVNSWEPNVDFGIVAHSDKLFFSYSTEQLLQGKLNFEELNLAPSLSRTHQIYAGGYISLNKQMRLIPSTFIKLNQASPLAMDINLKFDYQDRYYAMVGTRINDAFVVGGGVFINDQIKIGYSYDKSISQMKLVSQGSHEFYLGFELFKK